jgi:hypothetical protein
MIFVRKKTMIFGGFWKHANIETCEGPCIRGVNFLGG